jgi:cytoskeleton protein RodZ
MKTVGKQLQEARLARNWTPELASRETKIKVDRLRDLEADDYSNFTSPTYARGFVRTYARSLGLDEYRILRQLDNKLPDDDSANIASETGVGYLPETSLPPRAAHRDYTGLYIVMALGAVVTLAIVFVLFEAYRVGELSRYFASTPEPVAAATSGTNADGTPASPTADTTARALPVDSNTPPPIPIPIDDAKLSASAASTTPTRNPNAPDATTNAPGLTSPRALPVDPAELTNAAPATPNGPAQDAAKAPPRALPVDPAELTMVAENTPPPANGTNGDSTPPVAPAPAASEAATNAAPPAAADSNKRLVLTASQDCFVRVTNLDASEADKPLYAAVLRSGQSIGFDGRKFSINVGIPSAVNIKLDGVNYGPHSDQAAPETFTVESHLP